MDIRRLFARRSFYVSLFLLGLISLAVSFPFVSGSMKQVVESSSPIFASISEEPKQEMTAKVENASAANESETTSASMLAATTLSAGDIAIVGVNSDGTDNFAFVPLREIGSATEIKFTDRNWNGTTFVSSGSDSTVTFTAATNISTGTVISSHNSAGTLNSQFSAALNLDEAGDHILAYQGTDAAPIFLYAINFGDLNTTFAGTVPTGLAVGTNAVAIAGDNASFAGPTTPRPANSPVNLLLDVSDFNSWTANDNTPQAVLKGKYFSAPDQQLWAVGGALYRMNRDGADISSLQVKLFQNSPNPPTQVNSPLDIVFDTVHGLYFIADSNTGNRRILQGNISDLLNNPGVIPNSTAGGPTFKVLYTDQSAGTTGGQIYGLAIDVDAANASGQGHLYFVNKGNFNRITYSYNGASATSQTPSLLTQLPAGSFANEIALDIANNRAFVVSTGSHTAPIADPTDTPPCDFPNQTDPDTGECYFIGTTIANNEIWQVSGLDRTDTSTAQTTFARLDLDLATANGGSGAGAANGTGYDLPNAKGFLQSIDIDPNAGLLYFVSTQHSGGTQGTGGVYTYNLSNGTVTNLYAETIATDYGLEYIDVDPATERYYVSNVSFDDNNNLANTSSILTHGLSAGVPTQFAVTGDINGGATNGLIVINAPTLSLNQLGSTPVYNEQAGTPSPSGTAVSLISSTTANDLDTTSLIDKLSGATVRISNNFVSGDTLTFTNSGAITGTYNAATGVLTFTGASTFANYQTVLTSVKFTNSGDNPAAYGAKQTRTIAWSVTDGLLSSDEQSSTINIVGINDAPINGIAGGAARSVNEDTNLSVTGLSVSDVDADPSSQQLTTTLSVTNGTLNVGAVAGGALVTNSGTASVIISGTSSQINTTLSAANNVVYRGVQDYFGSESLSFKTNDQGNTGNDPGLTGTSTTEEDIDTINITVNPINDEPTLSAISNPADILEDAAQTINLSGISEGPANEASQTLTVTATSNNTALIPNPTVSFTEGSATGSLSYAPVANANGTAIITVSVTDSGGTANIGDDNTIQRTFTVNVTPVNDAPSFSRGADQVVLKNSGARTINPWATAVSKGPANESPQTLTFTVTENTNPALFSAAPAISPTGVLTFTPAANTIGTATLTVQLADNGGTANNGDDTSDSQTFIITVLEPPTVAMTFAPSSIQVGSTSLLTVTIGNTNASIAFTGATFADTLPAGMTAPNSSVSNCGGTLSVAANIVTLTGATVAANNSCVSEITVTGTTVGTKPNTVTVNTANAGTGYTAMATLTVNQPSIGGAIIYGTTPTGDPMKFVPGVNLNLTGSPASTKTSDSLGNYLFPSLTVGETYTVTPTKSGDVNDAVSSFDAALAARYAGGLITLTPNQITAADVSGNGEVSSYDAALIARTAGLIPNIGSGGQWRFLQPSTTYPSLSESKTGQNYQAILMGDVSGDWKPTAPPNQALTEADKAAAAANEAATYQYIPADADAERQGKEQQREDQNKAATEAAVGAITVDIPDNVTAANGATVLVPINLNDDVSGQGIISYAFTVSFNSAVLEPADPAFETANTRSGASGFNISPNTATTGQINIQAFSTTQDLSGSGTLLFLRFKVIGAAGATTNLTFNSFRFNEGTPSSMPTGGVFTVAAAPPTPATVAVAGRVTTAQGRGIGNVVITMVDAQGNRRSAQTTAFGYYRFDEVAAGETVTLTARGKRYQFEQASIVRTTNESVSDAHFVTIE